MHPYQTPARSFSPWPMSVCVCMRDSEIGCQRHITHPIGRDARLKNKGKLPVLLFGNAHAWTHLVHAHARDASLLCMCLCVCVWDNVQRARENCMRSNRNKKEKKMLVLLLCITRGVCDFVSLCIIFVAFARAHTHTHTDRIRAPAGLRLSPPFRVLVVQFFLPETISEWKKIWMHFYYVLLVRPSERIDAAFSQHIRMHFIAVFVQPELLVCLVGSGR